MRLHAIGIVATLALAAAPSLAMASDWYINGTVVNNTGSQADNCYGATGLGCVSVGSSNVVFDDASDVTLPTSPIASGSKGSFSFQADGFWEGADMYARYTMPDGANYEITAEDDVSAGNGGIAGNYAACSQNTVQSSSYVCTAEWAGTEENASPTYTFGPSASAPAPAAGQTCSGEMGGANPVLIDCTQTGQLGPTAVGNEMLLEFWSETNAGMYVQDSYGSNCRFYSKGQTCLIFTGGACCNNISIGTLENSTAGSFSVVVVGAAVGPVSPDAMPFWPPSDSAVASGAPVLSALALSPSRASTGTSRGTSIRRGRRATISYRNNRDATTVLTLARCASTRRGRCTRWAKLAHRTARTSLTRPGVMRRGRCKRASAAEKAGQRSCAWRMALRGHLAHRDHRGRNAVRFSGRIGGHALARGRYRITARARAHGTALVSKAVNKRFHIR